jgi:hypothetical protein
MVRSILVIQLENWRILLIRFVWLELENGLEFRLTVYRFECTWWQAGMTPSKLDPKRGVRSFPLSRVSFLHTYYGHKRWRFPFMI